METKSFVMFSSKTKVYDHDIEGVAKKGEPITIAWASFSTPDGSLVAAFADDDELVKLMDKAPLVKRTSKSGKPRVETRFPVKVIYETTDDPEIMAIVDIIELPPPSLRACNRAGAKIAGILA